MLNGRVITAYILFTILWIVIFGLPYKLAGVIIGGGIAVGWWIIAAVAGESILLSTIRATPLNVAKYTEIGRLVKKKMVGLKIGEPSLWIIHDTAPMVIAMGNNPKKSHLIFTQGFFERLDDKSQIGLTMRAIEDIRQGITPANTGLATLLWMILLPGRIGGWIMGKRPGEPSIIFTILNALPAFLIGWPLSLLGVDKRKIYSLDSSTILKLENPDYLPYGLMKLQEALMLGSFDIDLSFSGLCIVNPMSRDPFQMLFKIHPPTPKRIDRLRIRAKDDRRKLKL